MSSVADRVDIDQLINRFLEHWESGGWEAARELFSDDCELVASHLPDCTGAIAIAEGLKADRSRFETFELRASNRYIGGMDDEGVFSLYVFGVAATGNTQGGILFGMTLTGKASKNAEGWQLTQLRIALNWTKGNVILANHWTLPPGDRGWSIGDPAPTIVSELDSPWRLIPNSTFEEDSLTSVAQTYSRYSWALDQADMGLFAGCFTDDAAGDFNPMGIIEGRHSIVSTFKEFRRPWPWMQHFADVLKISVNEAEGTAKMIVGRIVPERSHLDDGSPLYGAHYRMHLRRQREGFWQITWSEYHPGGFSTSDAPNL